MRIILDDTGHVLYGLRYWRVCFGLVQRFLLVFFCFVFCIARPSRCVSSFLFFLFFFLFLYLEPSVFSFLVFIPYPSIPTFGRSNTLLYRSIEIVLFLIYPRASERAHVQLTTLPLERCCILVWILDMYTRTQARIGLGWAGLG
jgi:hypothetical protein